MLNKIIVILLIVPAFWLGEIIWKPIKISDKISVSFPGKVEKTTIDGKQVWMSDLDSTSKCMLMVSDFSKMGLDAKTLAEKLKQKSTYQSIKNGMLLGSDGGVALKESITKYQLQPAYYLELDLKGAKDEYNKTYIMNIFIGAKMYSLTFMETYGQKHETARIKFFNSFKL